MASKKTSPVASPADRAIITVERRMVVGVVVEGGYSEALHPIEVALDIIGHELMRPLDTGAESTEDVLQFEWADHTFTVAVTPTA